MFYIIKIIITTFLVIAIAELAKRNSIMGAVLASIPLISVLAMLWLYLDTKNAQAVATLSKDIFWLVLPSLSLFIALPILLKTQLNFYLCLLSSILICSGCYSIMLLVLKRFGATG